MRITTEDISHEKAVELLDRIQRSGLCPSTLGLPEPSCRDSVCRECLALAFKEFGEEATK